MEEPIVTVVNAWPGAAPTEIESELTVPAEIIATMGPR
jgi:multidrug efflux pump subunit AcrB